MKQEHLSALDIGRGLAIVAVIYGHALAPWVLTAGEDFNEAAFLQWKLGAAFLMPFFFFLSGLGWREQKSLGNAARQSLTLILIALFASVAYDLARFAASLIGIAPMLGGQALSAGDFFAGLAQMILIGDYYSLSPLWFVVALAIVRLLASVALRLKPVGAAVLGCAVLALSLAAIDLDWRNMYQIKPLGAALAFFTAGRLARGAFHALEAAPRAALMTTLIGAAAAAATFDLNQGCRWDALARCGEPWLEGRFGVAMIHGQIGNIPLFAVTAFAGIAFAAGLSLVLARAGGVIAEKLDAWGGNSLNLLIVNAGFLHIGGALFGVSILPHVEPEGPLFFLVLFAAMLTMNVLAMHALERPLRWLHRAAHMSARSVVGSIKVFAALLTAPQQRVSQRNE